MNRHAKVAITMKDLPKLRLSVWFPALGDSNRSGRYGEFPPDAGVVPLAEVFAGSSQMQNL
jgi:hypothetical protein